ncbi:MAG: hypothetical protein KAU50_04275 [Candidatus Marinimicrobia bacterium]|nr:hypothetical protein [Candidatus Neomarinimicrobiota bacterium]
MKNTIALLIVLGTLLTGCGSILSEEAHVVLIARTEPIQVTVFPVHVVLGDSAIVHDNALTTDLVDWLRANGLAQPVQAGTPAEVPIQWGRNQAAMLRRSAEAFAGLMAADPPQTGYALMVEILSNRTESWVGGIHYYLVDQEGRLAAVGLTNSHWKEFQQVKPKDRAAGLEVLKLMLREGW